MNRDAAEHHTGSTFPPQILSPETGRMRRLDTVDRLEIWDWVLGYRLAMDRSGAIYIREDVDKPYRPVDWELDQARLRATFCEFIRDYGEFYDPPLASLRSEITAVAARTLYNPISARFEALEWDGHPRLFANLADRIEWSVPEAQDDTAVLNLAIAVIFLGAVERAHRSAEIPLVPVLYGGQGIGKTATIKALAGLGDPELMNSPYFGAIVPYGGFSGAGLRDNFYVKRIGKVITELKEIDGLLNESNEPLLKALFDDPGTAWRSPYAHCEEYRTYSDVLIGTTNEPDMLTDFTGNRRYIPIRVRAVTADIDEGGDGWRLDLHPEIVAQLWAEAYHLYRSGQTWRDFYTPDVAATLVGVTSCHTRRNAYYDLILDKAARMLDSDRCISRSISMSKLKETCAEEFPFARKLMEGARFESRLKALAPSHGLVVVRRHHRWGDEPRTTTCSGFARADVVAFDEEDCS